MKSTLTLLLLAGVATYYYFASRPAPAAHRYSADDVFFLRRYVSVRTPKGSIGLLPGQEVRRSTRGQAAPGKVSVTDGRDTLEIERDALTHDIDEAAALQASDFDWQNSVQAKIAETTQTAELQTQAYQAAMADGINASSAWTAHQNMVGNYQTRLFDAAQRRATGGSQYAGPVIYPVAAARPATSAVSVERSVPASFTPVVTVQPATTLPVPATNHFVTPLTPAHGDLVGSARLLGTPNQ